MTGLQADMTEKKESRSLDFVILEGQLFLRKQTGRDKIEKGKFKLGLMGKVRLKVWLSHI